MFNYNAGDILVFEEMGVSYKTEYTGEWPGETIIDQEGDTYFKIKVILRKHSINTGQDVKIKIDNWPISKPYEMYLNFDILKKEGN